MYETGLMKNTKARKVIVVSIMLLIAFMHIFRLGTYLTNELRVLYYSYASDLIVPFGVYFLLSMEEIYIPLLKKWYVKAAIVIIICSISELMQLFGLYFFGQSFDLLDIAMFAAGTLLAALFDKKFLERFVPSWKN